MKVNIGSTDRVLRLAIGMLILIAGMVTGGWWAFIGLIMVLTSAIRFCPAYTLIGFSTCEK